MHCPSRRRRRGAVPACLVLLAALTALVFTACGASGSGGRVALHGAVLTSAVPKPQVTLTDTAGQPFSLPAQTNSKLTLLYFGYTHCPDVCPTHMAAIGTALKNLPPEVADHVRVVFVTTDPARDTAQVLRSWLDHFDPDGRHYVGLTGTPQAIAATEQAFGVPPAVREDLGHGQYGVSHAAYVIAFTPDGLAHLAYPSGIRAQDWAHDLQRLATRGWQPA